MSQLNCYIRHFRHPQVGAPIRLKDLFFRLIQRFSFGRLHGTDAIFFFPRYLHHFCFQADRRFFHGKRIIPYLTMADFKAIRTESIIPVRHRCELIITIGRFAFHPIPGIFQDTALCLNRKREYKRAAHNGFCTERTIRQQGIKYKTGRSVVTSITASSRNGYSDTI